MTICIDGPLVGRDIEMTEGVTILCACLTGACQDEPFVYHLTIPTDLAVGALLFGTDVKSKVLEWHERDWVSPRVRAIMEAFEAT